MGEVPTPGFLFPGMKKGPHRMSMRPPSERLLQDSNLGHPD